eukprot:GHVL01032417.1.p1 GENE.GHVL01032417.1~~GHVL01032417.1.p1  ORF type:complete len:456 (+),score=50.47 GHVL01032417.1:61-1428(+)
MDEGEYDVVVCGTGLKECILSGLLSVHGKRVLHLDRNGYYGGEAASLNLTNLYQKFYPQKKVPESLGVNRDWNVDLVPKFVMADGKLVSMLLKTKVTRYLEWKSVDGTYVYQYQKAGLISGEKYIHKVPSNDNEALKSPLMGLQEKFRCKSFMQFAASYDSTKKETWKSFNPDKTTMEEVYKHFNLQPNTIDFIGHAIALYYNDGYLKRSMRETMDKIGLYMNSISRYGNSPFIYPVYGLGGLPEGFSRMCAIHGGTYMLNTPVTGFEFNKDGKVCGVRSNDQVAKCKMVVCDPTYVSDLKKTKTVGKIVRCICILDHPIPNTNNAKSCQIIIPQKQLNRQNDVYIMMVSHDHGVASKDRYIAIVSTCCETDDPETEILPALEIIGPTLEKFSLTSPLYVRTDDGKKDNLFVSDSYDALSHFETVSDDCMKMWKMITGEDLDLTPDPNADAEDEN